MCFLSGIENCVGFHPCTDHPKMQIQSKRADVCVTCCVSQVTCLSDCTVSVITWPGAVGGVMALGCLSTSHVEHVEHNACQRPSPVWGLPWQGAPGPSQRPQHRSCPAADARLGLRAEQQDRGEEELLMHFSSPGFLSSSAGALVVCSDDVRATAHSFPSAAPKPGVLEGGAEGCCSHSGVPDQRSVLLVCLLLPHHQLLPLSLQEAQLGASCCARHPGELAFPHSFLFSWILRLGSNAS